MWPKRVGVQTPCAKNSESWALCKLKYSKKNLTSNLAWPKKVAAKTPPALCKWKNSKKFLASNLMWQKIAGAHTPPLKKFRV